MSELTPGDVVDRYTVEGVIGSGGMAVVYRLNHMMLDRPAALKVLSLRTRAIQKRLLQEGRVQAGLRHRNILAVLDVVAVDGGHGLVLELIEGPTLREWLDGASPPLAQRLDVFRGVVRGVAHAHGQGLVHRDLKPGNVLLSPDEDGFTPKVADFGLAKVREASVLGQDATRSNISMGTPAYMAPEQFRDAKDADTRADVWSLGVMLYELVAGHRPFQGDHDFDTYSLVTKAERVPLKQRCTDVPDHIAGIVEACLQPDRELRPRDAGELMEWLRRADSATKEVVPAASPLEAEPTPPSSPPAPPDLQSSPSMAPADEAPTDPDLGPTTLVPESRLPAAAPSPVQTTLDSPAGSNRRLWGVVAVQVGLIVAGLWAWVQFGGQRLPPPLQSSIPSAKLEPVSEEPAPAPVSTAAPPDPGPDPAAPPSAAAPPTEPPPPAAVPPEKSAPPADRDPAPRPTTTSARKTAAPADTTAAADTPEPPAGSGEAPGDPAASAPPTEDAAPPIDDEPPPTEPPPTPTTGVVKVSGYGGPVVLKQGARSWTDLDAVPPGTWMLHTSFGGSKVVPIVEFTVTAGKTTTLKCKPSQYICSSH